MSRRSKIPGTPGPGRRRFEIATGGRQTERLFEVMCPKAGTLQEIAVRHDADCPCLRGAPMARCSCEIVEVEVLGSTRRTT